MAMTDEQFDEMVRRLEEVARRNPSRYKLRVGLLAALGYGYLLAVLSIALGIIVGLSIITIHGQINFLIIKFGWILIAFAAVVLRAFWVNIPVPEGENLPPEAAPRLFSLAEELATALDAPRADHILINNEFNASVAQVPRFGAFGWKINYLSIGLPLAQAISPEQLRAVLAHEFGHLSENHGRFGAWIYRLRQIWIQILEQLEKQQRYGSAIFTSFLHWYVPHFNAYSFVLARRHEYEADMAAAHLAGASGMAEALIDLEVKDAFLSGTYWPEVFSQMNKQAAPPKGAYLNISGAFREQPGRAATTTILRQVLSAKANHDDTHPSLSARLKALGYTEENGDNDESLARRYRPAPLKESAGHYFFGNILEQIAERLEARWREDVAPFWRERHQYALDTQKHLDALEEKARTEMLTLDEAWNRAYWTAELKGQDASIELLHDVLKINPDHPAANFALGQVLLGADEFAGIAYLEKAMAVNSEYILPGCECLYDYLDQRARAEEAESYLARAQTHYEMLVEAQHEREQVNESDELEPHALPSIEVERLREQLALLPQIKIAYLARKKTKYLPEQPFYLVGVMTRYPWYKYKPEQADQALLQQLLSEIEYPGYTYVVILNGKKQHLKKVLQEMAGAEIYHR